MKLPPEYIHVLLNPVPVYGLALGVVAMGIAFALRSRAAQVVALALVCLSSATAWPVYYFGEKGAENVMMIADKPSTAWLDEHQSRGEKAIVGFYIVAAVALATLVMPRKWPGSATPLTVVTFIAAVLMLAAGIWIAYAGGRIRHEEFRGETPPPAAQAEKE